MVDQCWASTRRKMTDKVLLQGCFVVCDAQVLGIAATEHATAWAMAWRPRMPQRTARATRWRMAVKENGVVRGCWMGRARWPGNLHGRGQLCVYFHVLGPFPLYHLFSKIETRESKGPEFPPRPIPAPTAWDGIGLSLLGLSTHFLQ
jgi:hypothetical protein